MFMAWLHVEGLGTENAGFDKIDAVWKGEGLADVITEVVCWWRVQIIGRIALLSFWSPFS